jgi:hypothetical protein
MDETPGPGRGGDGDRASKRHCDEFGVHMAAAPPTGALRPEASVNRFPSRDAGPGSAAVDAGALCTDWTTQHLLLVIRND